MAKDEHGGRVGSDPEFVTRAIEIFARDVFAPMCERASVAPDDVRAVIGEIRHKIDALDIVVATLPGARGEAGSAHPALQAALLRPVDPDRVGEGLNGTRGQGGARSSDAVDDIGRNQRSRLRELTLLDFLSRDTRPYSLQQVLNALLAKGFDDSSGAVVSQLHRLKKLGVIEQPAGGMYEITNEGLSHLHKLRASFGSLMGNGG